MTETPLILTFCCWKLASVCGKLSLDTDHLDELPPALVSQTSDVGRFWRWPGSFLRACGAVQTIHNTEETNEEEKNLFLRKSSQPSVVNINLEYMTVVFNNVLGIPVICLLHNIILNLYLQSTLKLTHFVSIVPFFYPKKTLKLSQMLECVLPLWF